MAAYHQGGYAHGGGGQRRASAGKGAVQVELAVSCRCVSCWDCLLHYFFADFRRFDRLHFIKADLCTSGEADFLKL